VDSFGGSGPFRIPHTCGGVGFLHSVPPGLEGRWGRAGTTGTGSCASWARRVA